MPRPRHGGKRESTRMNIERIRRRGQDPRTPRIRQPTHANFSKKMQRRNSNISHRHDYQSSSRRGREGTDTRSSMYDLEEGGISPRETRSSFKRTHSPESDDWEVRNKYEKRSSSLGQDFDERNDVTLDTGGSGLSSNRNRCIDRSMKRGIGEKYCQTERGIDEKCFQTEQGIGEKYYQTERGIDDEYFQTERGMGEKYFQTKPGMGEKYFQTKPGMGEKYFQTERGMGEKYFQTKRGIGEKYFQTERGIGEKYFQTERGIDDEYFKTERGIDDEYFRTERGIDDEFFKTERGRDEEYLQTERGIDEEYLQTEQGIGEEYLQTKREYRNKVMSYCKNDGRKREYVYGDVSDSECSDQSAFTNTTNLEQEGYRSSEHKKWPFPCQHIVNISENIVPEELFTRDELLSSIVSIICRSSNGSLSLQALAELVETELRVIFSSPSPLIKMLKERPDIFSFEPSMGIANEPVLNNTPISLKTGIRLCPEYSKERGNCNHDCNALHICKFYILSSCPAENCKFNHNIFDEGNVQVLQKHLLFCLNEERIKTLISKPESRNASTQPAICRFYNMGTSCQRGNNLSVGKLCQHLHVCRHFILGSCKFRTNCKRSHQVHVGQPFELLRLMGLSPHQYDHIRIIKLLRDNIDGPRQEKTRIGSGPKVPTVRQPLSNAAQAIRLGSVLAGSKPFTQERVPQFRSVSPQFRKEKRFPGKLWVTNETTGIKWGAGLIISPSDSALDPSPTRKTSRDNACAVVVTVSQTDMEAANKEPPEVQEENTLMDKDNAAKDVCGPSTHVTDSQHVSTSPVSHQIGEEFTPSAKKDQSTCVLDTTNPTDIANKESNATQSLNHGETDVEFDDTGVHAREKTDGVSKDIDNENNALHSLIETATKHNQDSTDKTSQIQRSECEPQQQRLTTVENRVQDKPQEYNVIEQCSALESVSDTEAKGCPGPENTQDVASAEKAVKCTNHPDLVEEAVQNDQEQASKTSIWTSTTDNSSQSPVSESTESSLEELYGTPPGDGRNVIVCNGIRVELDVSTVIGHFLDRPDVGKIVRFTRNNIE